MITKKQWNKFCLDVWYLRSKLGYYQVTINGWGIKGIDQQNKVFVLKTIRQSEPPTVYRYQDSFEDHTNLKTLYRSVNVSSDMDSLFPFLKKGGMIV